MWRSVGIGLALAGVLAGCSVGGGSGRVATGSSVTVKALTSGPDTVLSGGNNAGIPVAQLIEREVEKLTVPPRHAWHLVAVRCTVTGALAVCHGKGPEGKDLPAVFRVPRSGPLDPVCASKTGNVAAPANIFCVE